MKVKKRNAGTQQMNSLYDIDDMEGGRERWKERGRWQGVITMSDQNGYGEKSFLGHETREGGKEMEGRGCREKLRETRKKLTESCPPKWREDHPRENASSREKARSFENIIKCLCKRQTTQAALQSKAKHRAHNAPRLDCKTTTIRKIIRNIRVKWYLTTIQL